MFAIDSKGRWHVLEPKARKRRRASAEGRLFSLCGCVVTRERDSLPAGEHVCQSCDAKADKMVGRYFKTKLPQVKRITSPRPVKPLEGQAELFPS